MIKLTLGTDSEARKRVQLVLACFRYMPAALARFALHSKAGNDKHNPGEPIHHARGKSMDHEECIARHLFDMQDIEAYIERNGADPHVVKLLLDEATAEFWRAGIFLQELCEKYEGAPLAPAARLPEPPVVLTPDDDAGKIDLDALCPGMSPSLKRGFVPSGTVDEPVAQTPDEGAPRCGYMSRTKRVCTRPEGHEGAHFAEGMGWFGEGHPE
jgi:hypothetical protein